MIRKILKPKVLENLIKLAYSYENRPKISILNQEVNFVFESFEVSGWNDPTGKIKAINFKDKVDNFNMTEVICNKIKSDFDVILYTLTWVDGFEFF